MAFLARWWHEQPPTVQSAVAALVQDGRLTFANGGWSMHDEATPYYTSMIDNTAFGHEFLNATFGAAAFPSCGYARLCAS